MNEVPQKKNCGQQKEIALSSHLHSALCVCVEEAGTPERCPRQEEGDQIKEIAHRVLCSTCPGLTHGCSHQHRTASNVEDYPEQRQELICQCDQRRDCTPLSVTQAVCCSAVAAVSWLFLQEQIRFSCLGTKRTMLRKKSCVNTTRLYAPHSSISFSPLSRVEKELG